METTSKTLELVAERLEAVSDALSAVPSGDNDSEWNKFSALQGHVNDGLELITELLDAARANSGK